MGMGIEIGVRRESTLVLDRTWNGDAWNQSLDETLGFFCGKLEWIRIRANLVSVSVIVKVVHFRSHNGHSTHYPPERSKFVSCILKIIFL